MTGIYGVMGATTAGGVPPRLALGAERYAELVERRPSQIEFISGGFLARVLTPA